MQVINTQLAPAAVGPYSQAVKANGLVFCSGQIPLTKEGDLVVGDAASQCKQILTNLEAVLREAGSNLDRVLKTTIFLTDIADFASVNEVYARFFGVHKPARSTVAVAALPKGARLEIECIALAPDHA